MYDFEYVKPGSVADAAAALADEDATALGGGQTLLPTLKQRLANPGKVVDLSGCLADTALVVRDGDLRVSGRATHATVALAASGGLQTLADGIGDPQVRHRGTIGGSLANNDPAACYPAAVLALGATIQTDRREIAADDFFTGLFETALEPGEIIVEVSFPTADSLSNRVEASAYMKFVQPASRFALVGVFVARFASGVRVAVTGASEDGVYRWTEAEAALGASFSSDAVAGLSAPADGMIGDLHGAPDYRAHLVGVMTQRAVAAAS